MKNPTIFLVFLLSCVLRRLHCAAARLYCGVRRFYCGVRRLYCGVRRLYCGVRRFYCALAEKSERKILVFFDENIVVRCGNW